MMKEYRYSGLISGVTLSDGTEVLLWSGRTVSLPGEHDYVKILVMLKHLMPGSKDAKPAVTPAVQPPKRRSSSDSETKTRDVHGN